MAYIRIGLHAVWGTKKRIPFLLKNSIATVIIHIKPKFVNRLMVLISIRAKAKGLYSLIISAINSGDSQPQSQWCAFAMRAGL